MILRYLSYFLVWLLKTFLYIITFINLINMLYDAPVSSKIVYRGINPLKNRDLRCIIELIWCILPHLPKRGGYMRYHYPVYQQFWSCVKFCIKQLQNNDVSGKAFIWVGTSILFVILVILELLSLIIRIRREYV